MNLTEKINQLFFKLEVRSIEKTPPLYDQGGIPIVLSMVQHRDVHAYLLAIKSFCRFIQPARVVVIADPTLSPRDRVFIKHHIKNIQFRDAQEFQREGIPKGGCWERLCAISEYVADSYIIQLDADTVTVGPQSEIASAIHDGVAFILATENNQRIQTCHEIAEWARNRLSGNDHIQLVAESNLDQIEESENYRYVRGCAGFSGYPQNSFNFDTLLQISEQMGKIMSECWSEWGTEQFTSNLILSSMLGSRLLPHPKYCAPHRCESDTVFFHFIGYVRFTTPLYTKLARRVISELARSA